MHDKRTPAIRAFEAEQQFQLLVQSVVDYAIYMLDPDGYICNWNEGGRRIKGYDDAEIIGQHFSRFYELVDRDAGEPEYGLRMARENGRYEKEGWRLRKDGSRFWASVVIDPIRVGGQLIGYAKVARDITERHESALRLAEAQQALLQAKKIEAIGKLTLGLSHDFNNLLGVIVNSLDLISAHRDDEKRVTRLVEGALRAADRGMLLTRQLLSFARGQALAPEVRDVNELVLGMKDVLMRSCGLGVDIELSLAQDLPPIRVDPTQLEAALLNLVINSRDSFAEGGTITVATGLADRRPPEIESTARDFVCVCVVDDGSGMSDEVVQQAVQPFFTTKEVGRGSGLGLSQAHGFAAQSGGYLHITSEPGQGTRVTLYFPALED
ncbi:PAS domain-containing sensor histidine kinase [Lysobacter sp. Root916]|uniref:ATP-binding protein n=1 Tax=Lysobacter sp. Root916 TaxID=1736606 RepID=UPI0007105F04|nr:ATP-binding protein [Lysobacter sp. Root916]KRD39869.1 PAS domain-containing sensor histidine kinase [Lysobacter sp. Root916]